MRPEQKNLMKILLIVFFFITSPKIKPKSESYSFILFTEKKGSDCLGNCSSCHLEALIMKDSGQPLRWEKTQDTYAFKSGQPSLNRTTEWPQSSRIFSQDLLVITCKITSNFLSFSQKKLSFAPNWWGTWTMNMWYLMLCWYSNRISISRTSITLVLILSTWYDVSIALSFIPSLCIKMVLYLARNAPNNGSVSR